MGLLLTLQNPGIRWESRTRKEVDFLLINPLRLNGNMEATTVLSTVSYNSVVNSKLQQCCQHGSCNSVVNSKLQQCCKQQLQQCYLQ